MDEPDPRKLVLRREDYMADGPGAPPQWVADLEEICRLAEHIVITSASRFTAEEDDDSA